MMETLKKLRRELHQHPELSGVEFETSKRIHEFIKEHHNTKIIQGLGGTGLAAVYEFPEKGPTILIRCELDALPIDEPNSFDYKSVNKGVSHKCGHDGHMTIVAGLIFKIKASNFNRGKIVLLFQPAEENGKGARNVLRDKKFNDIIPDYAFSLHNIPGQPMNSVITIDQLFTPSVISFSIDLLGRESHAAEPENGLNPALAISEIIQSLSKLSTDTLESENDVLLTPVYMNMGKKAYGISAGFGEVHYTMRTWRVEKMSWLKEQVIHISESISKQYQLKTTVRWFDEFPTNTNHDICNTIVKDVVKEKKVNWIQKKTPFSFGEDFGWFSQQYPSAMFGLGSGVNTPALHHDDYDFPEEIITTGIEMFFGIIEKTLKDSLK